MKKKLNILIDAHSIGDNSGGNETYWKNLIKNLPNQDNYNNYIIKYNKNNNLNLSQENFISQEFLFNNTFYRNLIDIPINNICKKFDIIHSQYFLPLGCGLKDIVSIHDISFLHYPECFTKKQLVINKNLIKKAAEKSKYIITISEFSKQDIVKNYSINPEKVFVTYLAASEIFKPIVSTNEIKNIIEKYNIRGKYILTVGNLQPRKNLDRLIRAFNYLQKDEKFKYYKLVIVGKKNWQLDKLFNDVSINENIILTGYVPDEDLSLLYNGCDVFVYPSLFEGFGLPVLEALKCGKAVLTSNTSSLPEVIGEAGLLFNPLKEESIADSIASVLINEQFKSKLENDALIQASKFSWEKTANETVKVYEKFNCI